MSALLRQLVASDRDVDGPSWAGVLRPRAVIGSYELVRQVGRGGFGIVYEAIDLNTGRAVAFKAVYGTGRPDVGEERVLREAELAARLSHPNIVALHDVGRSEHGPYLVLELLEGETLGQRMRRAAMPIGDALRIASDVARAMGHAHSVGVVHRDLTPGNVFLCRDGRVKVLDLGMAHAFGRRKIDGGTPTYMAPEQRRGAPEDERTDVYAMGVLLYEMLTRRVPPERRVRGSSLEVAGAPGLAELLDAMLAPDPVSRPRDAGEVSATLATIIADLRCDRRAPAVVCLEPSVRARASLAVLPFSNLDSPRDEQYLGEGLAKGVLAGLEHFPELRIAGRASSFWFQGRAVSIAEIGRKLDVSSVLEGSFRTDGARICVDARLVAVGDGSCLWSGEFDRELAGVFAIQDDIARAVVGALRAGPPSNVATAGRPRPANVEAYNTYVRGHHFFVRGLHAEALEHFDVALRLDPHYAPVLAGIAYAALFLQEFDHDVDAAYERPREAIAAAERAVAESPDFADGYAARGIVRAAFVHDWEGALADVDRAVELRRDSDVLRAKAIVHFAIGQSHDAIALFREATQLDPLSPAAWNSLGAALLAAGDLDRAKDALQRALAISPAQAYAPGNLGTVLLLEGRPAEALNAWQRSTSEIVRMMGSAIVHQRLGNRKEADRALDMMTSQFGDQGSFRIAQVLGAWGDTNRAIEWLERARRRRSARLALEIKSHPFLRPLREAPGFRLLLEKLDLPLE
jgi:serine/threonine protein kinase/tetratricopeptide (TPR) repeat protein